MHRLNYIARLIYWSFRHMSVSNARWVLDYENVKWKKD